MDFFFSPAVNSAGGLLCVWNKDCLEVSNLYEGKRAVVFPLLTYILHVTSLLQKRRVWEELVQMKSNSNSNFGALLMILIASGGKTKGKGQLKLVVEGVREGNSTNSLPIWE